MVLSRKGLVWIGLLVSCCVFWAAAFTLVASALADPYEPPELPGGVTEPAPEYASTCPAYPGVYEGEDEVVDELRKLRNELRLSCKVLRERADVQIERFWWLVAEAVEAGAQRALANEKLTSLVEASGTPVEVEPAEGPLPVADSALSSAQGEIVESVDASGEALKGALWFLVGAVVAGLASYLIYRQVMPRG